MKQRRMLFHLVAALVILVWGTTFVSTKVLLRYFSPVEIMFLRFTVGYLALWAFYPHYHRSRGFREELLFCAAALSGGTLYFLSENTALQLTQASNVSLIVASAPLLTALVMRLFARGGGERLHRGLLYGFLFAFAGVFLVVTGGQFSWQVRPLGDLLALLAALIWAFYGLTQSRLGEYGYNHLYVTRKMFFYVLLTSLPLVLSRGKAADFVALREPVVLANLLFLGLVASALCYVLWSATVEQLGVVRANNYIYFIPPTTMLFSVLILHEELTVYSLAGCALILFGVWLSEHPAGKRSGR